MDEDDDHEELWKLPFLVLEVKMFRFELMLC